jgi:hypothetical protein
LSSSLFLLTEKDAHFLAFCTLLVCSRSLYIHFPLQPIEKLMPWLLNRGHHDLTC